MIKLELRQLTEEQWPEIIEIYKDSFPKREQKPLFVLKHSVKTGKIKIFAALEEEKILGFAATIPYKNMVMVDYLAVSKNVRSKGTGSFILNGICEHFSGRKIVLLIERVGTNSENEEQIVSRRKFYLKNGFYSSGIFMVDKGGEMEVMNFQGKVTPEDFIELQKYTLGWLFYKLSGTKLL